MTDPSYRDAGDDESLPTDIREHIEAALPCPAGGQHRWRHMRSEFYEWGQREPVRVLETWECPCGLVHTTDPEQRR